MIIIIFIIIIMTFHELLSCVVCRNVVMSFEPENHIWKWSDMWSFLRTKGCQRLSYSRGRYSGTPKVLSPQEIPIFKPSENTSSLSDLVNCEHVHIWKTVLLSKIRLCHVIFRRREN